MEKRSFENALRDLAQREHRVAIANADFYMIQNGRIHEVFDDYLVLKTGRKLDRDVLFPLGNIAWIRITKLAE